MVTKLTHKAMLELFKTMMPGIVVRGWWKKGPSTIRIRQGGLEPDLYFTYISAQDWKIETANMYNLSIDGV